MRKKGDILSYAKMTVMEQKPRYSVYQSITSPIRALK